MPRAGGDTIPTVPMGWLATPARDGVDLRVSPKGRGCIVAGAVTLALGWTGLTVSALAAHRALPLAVSPPVGIAASGVLALLALWCGFGAEVWHVAPNCIEHRVGIGGWGSVRRFRDAELEIVSRQDRYGRPYHRLYVIVGPRRHFLLERRLAELSSLAGFLAEETGWRIRGSA
jgi:hypothetical protein